MTHGSLFSGIGGFDLAAEWMGWTNVFHCEFNPFGQRVLKHYWPDSISYGDIKQSDFTIHRGQIDVLSGGFPCQPFSTAGKRKGTADDRHLWPQACRAVDEIKPAYAVFENVYGLTSILESACETQMETEAVKLFSEGDDSEEVEERIREVKQRSLSIIINDLYKIGYTLPENSKGEPIVLCVPACAVNAPHRRDRIWFVAHATGNAGRSFGAKSERQFGQAGATKSRFGPTPNPHSEGHQLRGLGEDRQTQGESVSQEKERQRVRADIGGTEQSWPTPDTTGDRREWRGSELEIEKGQQPRPKSAGELEGRLEGLCGSGTTPDTGSEGSQGRELNGTLDQETKGGREQSSGSVSQLHKIGNWIDFPTQPPIRQRNDGLSYKLDGLTISKHRKESIMAYGNAIVPQVAFEIFKVIDKLK